MLETGRYSPHPGQLGALTLALVGDGVYELMVREYLLGAGNPPAGKLHRETVQWVRAQAQARAYEWLLPLLTPPEQEVLRRGRNASPQSRPKNASPGDYHKATAVEALFGYLYLMGENGRLRQLFSEIAGRQAALRQEEGGGQ